MKYIDADALSESVNALLCRADANEKAACLFTMSMLANEPAADVIKASRARAKAPVVIGGNICDLRCPDCKARVGMSYHYCWQCGQKLDLRLIHGYAQ